MYYNIVITDTPAPIKNGVIVKVGFADPAQNDVITKEAAEKAAALAPQVAGHIALINGPASLPVAMTIAHAFGHVAVAVAAFDPKMGSYIVSVSHDPDFHVGDAIKA